MGMMTLKEINRRLEAGQLPSEISLLAWERQLKVINKLIEKQTDAWDIWFTIDCAHHECALCESYMCRTCPLVETTGVSCLSSESQYSKVNNAEYISDYIKTTKGMIEALKACVEFEHAGKTGVDTS